MKDPDDYQTIGIIKSICFFFFSKTQYLDSAINHCAYLSLKKDDLRQKYIEGTFDPVSQESKGRELQRFTVLRKQFWWSFLQMTMIALLALFIGFRLEVINPNLTLHAGKVIVFFGSFLIGWAAIFELGGPSLRSWGSETLSELIHPRLFLLLFIPGIFLLLLAGLL